jgi:C4-dicarboxylate-specific signal transduction histidine kinase
MTLLDISLQSRVIIGISAMVVLFASFLVAFISNQRKKITYHKNLQSLHEEQQQNLLQQNAQLETRVKERTNELFMQKEALQVALADLEASQLQLVQKEKMASLGEMASGIAHEIQNPLNFVNNFTELNGELLQEMRTLAESPAMNDAQKNELLELISNTLKNTEKVSLHGKRADNIIKSLLQHARSRSNEASLHHLNSLVEENLNLSYHHVCARDKQFSATISTSLDHRIDRVSIVAQDISRLLANLYDNAFYSLHQKWRQDPSFLPQLQVQTQHMDHLIRITIRDNGMGIPEKIMHKIYQPFFTTKPTGEGTGLGLSLGYEIVKAHRGEMRVSSREGEFAEFVIELPL